MSLERKTNFPFESDPDNKVGETVVIDRERLFTTWSPEPKTPDGYLQDFFRDVAVLPDVIGIAFSRVNWDGGISIDPITTTNTSTPRGNCYFNEVLGPRVNAAIDKLQIGLGLEKTYTCYGTNHDPDHPEAGIEAFREDRASSKQATLLRLVLFK